MWWLLLILITIAGCIIEPIEATWVHNASSPSSQELLSNNKWETDKINKTDLSVRIRRRISDPTFRGNPKTQEQLWHQSFKMNSLTAPVLKAERLVTLLNKIVNMYLKACISIVIYDEFVERTDDIMLQIFFQKFKFSYIHGKINKNYTLSNPNLLNPIAASCRNYILFLSDILRARDVLGPQTTNRVIIISRATQWKQQEFLSSKLSSDIVNLLVIGESLSVDQKKNKPYVMYTHQLYTDGLGSNTPTVLTSWINGQLSRPHINLFPEKYLKGFAGHRFIVSATHQPPFVIKKLITDTSGNVEIRWDGLEFRILKLLSQRLNFTYEIAEPTTKLNGPTFSVIDDVENHRADFGLAGAYVTVDRLNLAQMSVQHSKDCASFITLASKALPRYRAIMGPFQWPVWVAIIATYLLAIFPLAFSDRLTLKHLIGNWSEMENMFWYVFGTFTNSLTFSGQFSWSSTKKNSTRLLIGFYWIFTIIITACYTSSIIAFVTLPVFPETVDSVQDLLRGFFRIGTFENDGWQYWFTNSSHLLTQKLIKDLEFVANAEEGLNNVTKAFFWPYAFLGSRAQLEYIVEGNFTNENLGRTTALHIGDECLSIFGVSMIMPKNSVYTNRLNDAILRLQQNGLIDKMFDELQWDIQKQRGHGSSNLLKARTTTKLSSSDVDERGLTIADTEGMFLLMGIGYLIGLSILISEVIGGCANKCRKIARRASTAVSSISRRSSFQPYSSRKPSLSVRVFNVGADDDDDDCDNNKGQSSRIIPSLILSSSCNGIDNNGADCIDDGVKEKSDSATTVRRRQSDQTGIKNKKAENLVELTVGNSSHKRRFSSVARFWFGYRKTEVEKSNNRSEINSAENRENMAVRFIGNGHEEIEHVVEINRIPTPYSIGETFGEKVYN